MMPTNSPAASTRLSGNLVNTVASRLRSRLFHLLAAGALLAAGSIPATLVGAVPARAASFDAAAAEARLLAAINQDRAANGKGPLMVNPTISAIARDAPHNVCGTGTVAGRSQDMISRGYFDHYIPPCSSLVWPVLSSFGVQYSRAGENIGWNNYSPQDVSVDRVNDALMASPGHRANILGDYNQVGVGAAMAPGTWNGYSGVIMYTQIFTMGPAPAPPPPPPVTPAASGPGGYVLDGYGGVHFFGSSPNVSNGSHAYWGGWDIAHALAVRPDRKSGYVLDGWGGVHGFGGTPDPGQNAYWRGWDIARGLALDPSDPAATRGYVLDGWGGVHGFGGAPDPTVNAYWGGWDIARGVGVDPTDPTGTRGYVLDGWGGVHGFGGAPDPTVNAYWPGWDIARGIVVTGNGTGYVLDGWGGLHGFGGLADPTVSAYWPGWNIARGVNYFSDLKGGYVVDGWGGLHPFRTDPKAPVPDVVMSAYWPGWNIARQAT
jgi:uncharacterized protein YkwD